MSWLEELMTREPVRRTHQDTCNYTRFTLWCECGEAQRIDYEVDGGSEDAEIRKA